MLGRRVLSSAILIPVVGAAVYVGGLWFLAVVALAGLLAGYEYLSMMRQSDLAPSFFFGLLLIALFVADAQWPSLDLLRWGLALVPLAALTVEVFYGNAQGSLANWALTIAGAIYIGFSISHFVRLRAVDRGMWWVAVALLGTWICDSGAYFVGRAAGKTPFFPQISPKKTWEGAAGGFVCGLAAAVLLGRFLLGLAVGWGIVLGVLLVFGATFGDLAESVIKRQVGVKDSSNLIPGHGGMLDRVDSLLFVAPIVYCFASVGKDLLF
ncbi:MAG TPA: phosphatidate cytidylyltransferase [Anaerolineae bacterium]|nr:phosphatidate cytidylyltransferase [Anaerolineae bacterium]